MRLLCGGNDSAVYWFRTGSDSSFTVLERDLILVLLF